MFTVRVPNMEGFRLVLEVRADGALLVAGDEQPPMLRWVPADRCELGAFYMTQDQREWWKSFDRSQEE